jgi:hypothetical protein
MRAMPPQLQLHTGLALAAVADVLVCGAGDVMPVISGPDAFRFKGFGDKHRKCFHQFDFE